jgi:hypothetical protein
MAKFLSVGEGEQFGPKVLLAAESRIKGDARACLYVVPDPHVPWTCGRRKSPSISTTETRWSLGMEDREVSADGSGM